MTQNGEESELLLKKKQISGQRILSFLGLAAKARKTVSGTDAVMGCFLRRRIFGYCRRRRI